MQIAITTGEASGDKVAGELARKLKLLQHDIQIWGVGGCAMASAGVDVLVDTSRFGAIGVGGVLPLLPKILGARKQVFTALRERRPDVLVAIDAGAFHYGFGPFAGLCPWVRKNLPETRILAWMPPGSWRKTLAGSTLGACTDAVSSPFRWNASELQRHGVNATFTGHPLLDFVKSEMTDTTAAAKWGLDMNRPVVALLPGSREQELGELLPVMLDAAYQMAERVPGVQFLLGLAPTIDRERVQTAVMDAHRRAQTRARETDDIPPISSGPALTPVHVTAGASKGNGQGQPWHVERSTRNTHMLPLVIVEGATFDVLKMADVAVCVSGTVTLEAAILGTPMVIVYKLPKSGVWQYKLMKKRLPEHIGLPNLIAGEQICPELLQDAVSVDGIAAETVMLLLDPEWLFRMKEGLRSVRDGLGEPGAVQRTAELVVALGSVNRK
ncbi:MAG: lipid-A-disaccharide synthase [Armatimonadota bacterium]